MEMEIQELNKYFFDISNIFVVEQIFDQKTIYITPMPRPTDALILLTNSAGIYYQNNIPPTFAPPGSLVYLPQNSRYTFECSPAENCGIQKNLLFEFTLTTVETIRAEAPKFAVFGCRKHSERISFGKHVKVVSLYHSEIYQRLLYSLINSLKPESFSPLDVYKTAYEFFGLVSDSCRDDNKFQNSFGANLIKESIKYLENDEFYEISINQIANMHHISTAHYERIFRKCVGISPIEYKNIHKLNKIKFHLQENTLSLNELAKKMGFCDSGYLCRFFKRKTGMTPKEYKNLYTKRPEI